MDNRKYIMDVGNALATLAPNAAWCVRDGVIEWMDTDVTQPSQSEIDAEVKRLQKEHDDAAYARHRKSEYPDWRTQLNKIYDDGVTKWKAEMVDPVKAKYPKP